MDENKTSEEKEVSEEVIMPKDIKILEKIGLKKIGDETHIEERTLQYMVDCKFEKLDRINTQGFIKILTREYKLDLSAWSAVFSDYCDNNNESRDNNGLFVVIEDNKKSKKLPIFIFLVIVGSIGYFGYQLFQEKSYESFISVQKEETSTFIEANISEIEEQLEVNSMEDNSSIVVEQFDENIAEVVEKIEINSEVNQTATVKEVVAEEPKVEVIKEIPKKKYKAKRFAVEAKIKPNSSVWIGVIYLDNKRKRVYNGKESFYLNLTREQIVTTGHGLFDMVIDGEKTEHRRREPVRFHIKDGVVEQINWARFKELNEGKSW